MESPDTETVWGENSEQLALLFRLTPEGRVLTQFASMEGEIRFQIEMPIPAFLNWLQAMALFSASDQFTAAEQIERQLIDATSDKGQTC